MRLIPPRRLKRWLAYALLERLQMMAVRCAPRKVLLWGGKKKGPNPFGSAFKFRAKVTINNPGAPKRNHPVRIMLNAGNFNFAHARADGLDVRVSLADGVTPVGNSPMARAGFYRPLFLPGSSLAAITVALPYIPAGLSSCFIQYGNPAATDSSNQANSFKSASGLTASILVDNTVLADKQYCAANTHVWETRDGMAVFLFCSSTSNAQDGGHVWQGRSSDYLTNATPTWAFTKIIDPGAGNGAAPFGNGFVRPSNGDILCAVGVGTNAQIAGNLEPLYIIKYDHSNDLWSNYSGTNPLPNSQIAGGRQLIFGAVEQSSGELWILMMGVETANGPDVNGQFSAYFIVCPVGSDPTNGNNWALLGGSMATARVLQGGAWQMAGTVSTTNVANSVVTGVGTKFTQIYDGKSKVVISGVTYNVFSVTSDTSMTLASNAGAQSGVNHALLCAWNEFGVAMDANGNIAVSAWNNAVQSGRSGPYQIYSLSRDGSGNPVWGQPSFLTCPGGAQENTANQTDLNLDSHGVLYFVNTRAGNDVTVRSCPDWTTANGPTWTPTRVLVSGLSQGAGDWGTPTITILKNGVNADMAYVLWYYPPAAGGSQRNIGLMVCDTYYITLPITFLENWDAGNFTANSWTAHTNCSISAAQVLNGRTSSCLCNLTPVLTKTGVWTNGTIGSNGNVQVAFSQWIYVTSGHPAFALSVGNERYVWFSGGSPTTPQFYNGTGGSANNNFPNGGSVTNNAWHHAKLAIDWNTTNDANKLTLQLTLDGVWLGAGTLLNANSQLDLYAGDFITSAAYYLGDIAVEPWSDSEPTITVGAEEAFV